jgi:hypothetical protein
MNGTYEKYEGQYRLQEVVVTVKVIDGQLKTAFPGVPPGFEVKMESVGEYAFRMKHGPISGGTAVFHIDSNGQANKISIGNYELMRDDEAMIDAAATGQGLVLPPLELHAEKEAAFEQLYEEMMTRADGRFLDYTLPHPKHEFLRYVAVQEQIIFHGSGDPNIDEFRTVRTSMELRDKTGRGNLQAVYGTHDGLWPMFFAIVDRGQLTGSIRNGVAYHENDAGEQLAAYQFSINKEMLPKQPWREGTMYFLPRATFRRLPISDEAMSNEWASETAVKPIARLLLQPEDFPFLAQIGGHDDSELLRLGELGKLIFENTTDYEPLAKGYALKLDWNEDVTTNIIEYITLLREFMPQTAVGLRFEPDDGDVWFDLEGAPAYQQNLKDRLEAKFSPAADK